jgi:transposase-like protein
MKHTANAITVSLDLFFKGLSLPKIVDHLAQFHDTCVSDTTVYRWIRKYVLLMSERVDRLKPELSRSWHADETCLKVGGRNEYMWNMLDSKTRFLIATQVTERRSGTEARRIVRESVQRAGKRPRRWITDGLISYNKAEPDISKENGKAAHISGNRFTDKVNNNLIERFHGTVKERTKTMRGFRNAETANLFAKGYRVYYNFIRPHRTLKGRTPAEAANLSMRKGRNRWLGII